MIRTLGITATLVLVVVTVGIGLDLGIRGWGALDARYFIDPPRDLGRAGGIAPILVSTGIIVGTASVFAGSLGLCSAIAIVECAGFRRIRRWSEIFLNTSVGIPRIVWGLFGAAVFGGGLGLGFSVAAGVLTLTCMLAPMMTAGFIAALREVDPKLAGECEALGVNRWWTTWRQTIPAARPAITATIALGAGRGLGDAAALVFTAGTVTALPHSVFDPAATLSVHIYTLLTSVPGGQQAAYAAAVVLFGGAALVQACLAATHQNNRFAP